MLAGLLACGYAGAQTISSIQIATNPSGPLFIVDGSTYNSPQVFLWPQGSKHVVQFPLSFDPNGSALTYQNGPSQRVRYSFSGWQDNTGLLASAASTLVTLTADPSITSLVGTVAVSYEVDIVFYNVTSNPAPVCSGGPGSAPPSGVVSGIMYLDGSCLANSTSLFLTAGAHVLNAFPYPGWVFYGWLINGAAVAPAETSYNLTAPASITPQFSIGKRVQFLTNPPSLSVIVDHTTIQTPPSNPSSANGACTPNSSAVSGGAPAGFQALCLGQFDFLPGSKHQIAAPTPQQDQGGNYWAFSGFSNGQGQNGTYIASSTSAIDTVTANFAPGQHVGFTTTPGGLQLEVDGRTTPPPYNFIWGTGETHTVSAPAQQTDSQGRAWTFSSWSNGGAATQTVTVAASNLALAATYTELGQVQVTSVPPGLTFTVDGKSCVTPCAINKASGSQTQIAIPPSVPLAPGARYDFVSWSDGSTATSRQMTFNQNTQTLTASYQTSYQLTAVANPAKSATFAFSPASPDGFYASGTPVTAAVAPNNGYKFAHWAGALSGSFASGTLTMTGPQNVIADMVSAPSIAPAGIETAAGPTPDGSVGVGSIIAIYGQNLAPAFEAGPSNPLAQAIGNVTVTVNGQLLPLLFVSPGQIAAQMPWELTDGAYTLLMHSLGQPDVSGTVNVSRDAPAIFTQPNAQNNLPLILALHEDGSVISFTSPARPNEQISIYGTGFGPYNQPVPDGFPPPDGANTPLLVDGVTVTCGSIQVQPDWAGAATGMVGMTILKVTITDAFPAATTLNLTVAVNGKTSTPVSLPLQ